MTNTKQIIVDRFVEKALSDIFGRPKVPSFIDLFLRNRGIDLQEKVDWFDTVIKEYMTDDGKIKAEEFRKLVMDYLPEQDFYLQDKYDELKSKAKKLIGG